MLVIGIIAAFLRFGALIALAEDVVKIVTSSDGTSIYAEATGNYNNQHVVLVHAFQLSSSVFDQFVADPAIQASAYVVRFDQRGHGRSGKPSSADGYASHLYADDYAAVSAAFGLHTPIYIGWSVGSAIVADIATYIQPNPLLGVVYMDALPYTDLFPVIATPDDNTILPWLVDAGNVTENKLMEIEFGATLFADPATVPWPVLTSWIGMTTYVSPATAGVVLSRPQNTSALFALGAAGLPLLVIQGTADLQVNGTALVEALEPHFTDITVEWIEGGPHAVFFEFQSEVVALITSFIHRLTS